MNAQKLQSSVERAGQLELLVEDCNYQVGGYGNPDLRLHRVGTCAVVMFDAQMSFDPAEEQLDAPSRLVKHGDGEGGYFQVVGQKNEFPAGFRIVVSDLAQQNGKSTSGFDQCGFSNMIAAQAGEAIHGLRVMPSELKVAFCTSHEKSPRVGYQDEPAEIHVAAIHQIEGSCFEQQTVEPAHIVLPCTGNADAGRNRPAQIDLGMKLDTRLGLTEIGPWKKRQRQVDGRGVERVDRVVQIQAKILARIERSGLLHQTLGEVLPDPPVSRFVGIGESGFCNRLGESEMIERLGPCVEASGDVAQPVPGSHLRENHAGELLSESKMPNRDCGLVSLYYAVERLTVDQVENLGENEASGVHGRKFWKMPFRSSNPSHAFLCLIHSSEMLSRKSN